MVGARSEADRGSCAAADPSDLVMQAGRPSSWCRRPSNGSISEASGGLEGCAGSPQGRIRCAADPRRGKGRHHRGNCRAGTGRADALAHVADVASWLQAAMVMASTFVPESEAKRPNKSTGLPLTSGRRGDCRGLWPFAAP